jgi:hypothetical protein
MEQREAMTNKHGSFIWYELMTDDADAAQRFYADVVGWDVAAHAGAAAGGGDYRILSASDGGVGGLMQLDPKCHGDARPTWLGYFGVDDVDASAAGISAAGGKVMMGPMDLPGVGRVAMVSDPQGLPFYIMRGASEASSNAFDADAVGHCAWNELVTSDLAAAMDFYGTQLNIAKGDVMPMGDMGDYQFMDHDGAMIGGAMKSFAPQQPLGWTFYFRVADVDAAHDKIASGGGKVMMDIHQVPGGDWVVIALDPQGARFGVVGARKA